MGLEKRVLPVSGLKVQTEMGPSGDGMPDAPESCPRDDRDWPVFSGSEKHAGTGHRPGKAS